MLEKNILLIRTHKTLSAGGPVPPLGLLHIAGAIYKTFGEKYRVRIIDTGILEDPFACLAAAMGEMKPDIVGFNTLSCESDLMNTMAALVKQNKSDTLIIVGGAHGTLAKERLLDNPHIDVVVLGEGDKTIVDLLAAEEEKTGLGSVKGIVYREQGRAVITEPQPLLQDLDSLAIPLPVWDMINIYAYGRHRNWNGAQKEKYHIPAMSSRGCPFHCTFCRSRDNFGQQFRMRSAESFVEELKSLSEKYHISEVHFFDDVFNFDRERVKSMCALFKKAGRKWNLSFPNGLRADLMDDDVLTSLKKAGTYKIHYGIESASPRIQKMIKKDLDLDKTLETIRMTVAKGIITGGYFILGFPTETREEILRTVDFALKSPLDNAYFFKFTDFSGCRRAGPGAAGTAVLQEGDLHFYAQAGTENELSKGDLNEIVMAAQQQFYMNLRRIVRGFAIAPRKSLFAANLLRTYALILLAFLLRKLRVPVKQDPV
ncbi:MAG: radical SAM protein [bacterium]